MEKFIEQAIPVQVSVQALVRALHISDDPADEDCARATDMLRQALACARPKYVCGIAAVEEKGDDFVVVEGHRIVSPLVRRNLEQVHRIFPYVATCGTEVDLWSRQFTDMLEHYWADEIKNMILHAGMARLAETVRTRFFPAVDMSHMSPGSLPEWPVTEQGVLFSLIGNVLADTGVVLTDSFLMIPSKSVSGFFFSSETHFENCRLCPMRNCPGRRAKYQPD